MRVHCLLRSSWVLSGVRGGGDSTEKLLHILAGSCTGSSLIRTHTLQSRQKLSLTHRLAAPAPQVPASILLMNDIFWHFFFILQNLKFQICSRKLPTAYKFPNKSSVKVAGFFVFFNTLVTLCSQYLCISI